MVSDWGGLFMFLIRDKTHGDYLAGYTIAPMFTVNIERCYQYHTVQAAMNDLSYYKLENTCYVFNVKDEWIVKEVLMEYLLLIFSVVCIALSVASLVVKATVNVMESKHNHAKLNLDSPEIKKRVLEEIRKFK